MRMTAEEPMLVERLVRGFPRSSRQINGVFESDAELLRLNDGTILALTTDSICEEIETGLYDDPYLIGWMTVAANLSDLAAVGALPIGLLLNQTLQRGMSGHALDELQRGIAEACTRFHTPVLGGDTNVSSRLHMGATAVGLIHDGAPLMRSGCSPGDILYVSGSVGDGNAYAFAKLSGSAPCSHFLPAPRIDAGLTLHGFASSCIDTSDGLIAAVDQLMDVNAVGFAIDAPVGACCSDRAKRVCASAGLPEWFMCAGPHGEFELVFTIPERNERAFLQEAQTRAWRPVRLGRAVGDPTLSLDIDGRMRQIDSTSIRNISTHGGGMLNEYLRAFTAIDEAWRRS